jgi:protein-tyrosine phosphatase
MIEVDTYVPTHVLIVCAGNICRSPMAEIVLRHQLHGRAIAVGSAGLLAMEGSPIDPLAESVLSAHGLTGRLHVAHQINPAIIDAADLVLAMEKRHLAALHALSPSMRDKSFLLGKWQGDAEIPDPYGRQRPAFERAYQSIETALMRWSSHL